MQDVLDLKSGATPRTITNELLTTPDPLLEGRAVIIGVSIPEAQDMKQPPQGPEVSGAFYHATAVENLLTLGADRVLTYEPHHPDNELPDALLATWMLAFVAFREEIAVKLSLTWFVPPEHERSLRSKRQRSALMLTAVILAILTGWIIARWIWPMPGSNFAAIIVVVCAIETVSELIGKIPDLLIKCKNGAAHETSN